MPTDALWKALTDSRQLTLITGPCVIESEKLCLQVAAEMKKICGKLGVHYVFKASCDKANRTSGTSFRGLGLSTGLKILSKLVENLAKIFSATK